jgi:hypothetical protein
MCVYHKVVPVLIMHYAIKTCEGVDVQMQVFLISALDGEWLASHPRLFYPRGKSPQYPLDRRLDGPQDQSG